MKAKDTVMSDEALQVSMRKEEPNFNYKLLPPEIQDILYWTREDQAEISFQAGWEQGWNDNKPYLPDANEPWDREQTVFNDGKQVGRQEVFDFLHKNSAAVMMNEHALKSQLEKWGLVTVDEQGLQDKGMGE
uniref:Uncharacterized protein n=1 Tax=viral metagenome TaxID=1070528 RepID=A0A6M3LV76_9ZZZZ